MRIPTLTHVTTIDAVEDPVLRGRFSEVIISDAKKEFVSGATAILTRFLMSAGRRKMRKRIFSIFRGTGRVEWMWTMTNQQRYFDGFRIQISAKADERVFGVVSIGSCLVVYEAKEMPIP